MQAFNGRFAMTGLIDKTEVPKPMNEAAKSDATRLNAAERRVLDLLAQGHTAKSIAALTGFSVSAVNERLRTARSKTGAGSSRELARKIHAQENRDDKVGLFERPANATGSTTTTGRRLIVVGVLIVTILISAGVAATLILTQANPAAEVDPERVIAAYVDPALDALPPRGNEARRLAALVRTEARDAEWAARAEAQINAAYASPEARVTAKHLTAVRCAATICEATGTVVPTTSDTSPLSQGRARSTLREELNRLGLYPQAESYRASKVDASLGVFVEYYLRQGG